MYTGSHLQPATSFIEMCLSQAVCVVTELFLPSATVVVERLCFHMCLSVHRGRCTPPSTPPPSRRPLQRTVRILLECILVSIDVNWKGSFLRTKFTGYSWTVVTLVIQTVDRYYYMILLILCTSARKLVDNFNYFNRVFAEES